MPWWAVVTGHLLRHRHRQAHLRRRGGQPLQSRAVVSGGHSERFLEGVLRFQRYARQLRIYRFQHGLSLWVLKKFGVEETGVLQPRHGTCCWAASRAVSGATFGVGLIAGGLYLIYRGYIRWEISLSFLAGIFMTAWLFNKVAPEQYADPLFPSPHRIHPHRCLFSWQPSTPPRR
jgi:electron transport complex protein RnfD